MTGFTATFTYNFKADQSFDGSMSSGTYTFDGTKLAMTTTKMGTQAIPATAPQMTGELSEDGKVLTLHPPDLDKLLKLLGPTGVKSLDALKSIKMARDTP